MTNYCHLSYDERKMIEDGLNSNKSINQISIELNRSHSTILREIDRNKIYSRNRANFNLKPIDSNYSLHCTKLDKSPYVCNGCNSRCGCRKDRFTYYTRKAEDSYHETKKLSRQGISLTPDELSLINSTIGPLIKNGQTINHLYINHPNILNFSKPTFYNYVKSGIFEFGPLDFPRIIRFKKRKTTKRRTRIEKEILIGRKYEDFIDYTNKNPEMNIVEMDTVIGLRDEPDCILTLLWRNTGFMLMYKLKSKTTSEVTRVFDELQKTLTEDEYKRLFQIILTDNGSEFFDVLNIECIHETGELVTKLFFCDPSRSSQKGRIEKNHEFIRYVLPKKTSFKHINQNDCTKIANNINSLCRDSLNNKSPYEAMLFFYDESILKKLNCIKIKPNEIILNKKILTK